MKNVVTVLPELRFKAGRLQQKVVVFDTESPVARVPYDPYGYYTEWQDVPQVAADAPDQPD